MFPCNRHIYNSPGRLIFLAEWVLCSTSIEICASLEFKTGCCLRSERITGYRGPPGDVVIGGTFPVHVSKISNELYFTSNPPEMKCQKIATEYYKSMHALIFAVEEINADPELLPNITLSFQIFDKCTTLRQSAKGVLYMLSGGQEIVPNYQCQKGPPLAAIIGDSGSTHSMLMAQILGLYQYPQISYLSTNPLLSDRILFPSFFRTIPSDEFQMKGLAELVSYFGWSWVGFLADDDDYGQFGLQMAKQEIISAGACVAFSENILISQNNRNAPHLAQIIRQSSTKVVVVIASDYNFVIVVEELLKQNMTGYTWVASEGWVTSALLSEEHFQVVLQGTIGFAIHGGKMPKFNQYLHSLHPSNNVQDSFIREFWEQSFTCKWICNETSVDCTGNASIGACTGNENLESLLTEEYHRIPLNVYNAVYAIAWALQNLLNCTSGTGPFLCKAFEKIFSFQPWHLLYYIKNIKFKTKDGNHIFFDANGNPPALYDIVNWYLTSKGTLKQVVVGSYDLNAPDGNTLKVNKTSIAWTDSESQVPFAKCNPSCPSGFVKVIINGKPPCCYECAPCPQGQISNQTDSLECLQCSWDTWSNIKQNRCQPRVTEFLSYEEPLGYCLAATSIFSSLIPLIILGNFIYYKNTPIVRANNYCLSCLLLISLSLCFLCSLGFVGYPQTEKCLLRQVAFGMFFTLCISCVLAKTITVVIAFNATKPGSRLQKWTGVKVSYCVIVFCVFVQLFLCVTWLCFSPPFTEFDTSTKPGIIIVNCNEGSPTAFWCMLGYLGLLATISFIVAFLVRRLPDSFNEAKFITFSMLSFLTVWISFIPAYLSAYGKNTVAMEVFAILSSSWALVLCIFVPKYLIIMFRPNINTKGHLDISQCKKPITI